MKIVASSDLELWTQMITNHSSNLTTPIILISGAGAHAMFWTDTFCQQFIDAGFYVIRFDHRDCGLSDAVNWESQPYTIEDLAGDVLKIMDEYGIKKFHVIGHSMGGIIAQWLAYKSPQRILTYTSISVATCGMTGQPPKEVMDVLLQNQPTQNFAIDLNGYMRSWEILNGTYRVDIEAATTYTEDFYTRSKHLAGVAWHHIWCQQNYIDLRKQIKQIKLPGLFIHGDLDPLIPVKAAIETQKYAPHSRMIIIPGMGHMIFNKNLEKTIAMEIIRHIKSPSNDI
jgi:pimeloyl-ACP methyl ester carboxylesterase